MAELPVEIPRLRLLGGLAPDTDEPMPETTREYVQNHWRTIEARVPGTRFNYDFWKECQPRRATWPACRAIIAARNQGEHYDDLMTMAIQKAYYLQAQNPSENDTLVQLAAGIGLDTAQFKRDLDAPATMHVLQQEIAEARQLGLDRFPSLALVDKDNRVDIPVDYLRITSMHEIIRRYI